MGDLNREQLADITAQRLQENVARKNRQVGKQIDEANIEITSAKDRLTSIESKLNYVDISFSLGIGGSTTVGHSLGSVPSGWSIIDQAGGTWGVLIRTGWSASNISFSLNAFGASGSLSFKVRLYK